MSNIKGSDREVIRFPVQGISNISGPTVNVRPLLSSLRFQSFGFTQKSSSELECGLNTKTGVVAGSLKHAGNDNKEDAGILILKLNCVRRSYSLPVLTTISG